MPFGLSTEIISGITTIIAANPLVEKITLYGSRAKGNARPGSDIDISVDGPGLSLDDFLNFALKIDRLELAQKVDLVHVQKVNDGDLIDHINRVGIILYEGGHFRKYGLPPVIDERSRILILGSFPSEVSLLHQQYYANPRNAFWRVILAALDESYSGDYDHRIAVLKKHRIALWDVVESCFREGSADDAIKHARQNDLSSLTKRYPSLTHLLFNGNNPVKLFTSLGMEEGKLVFVPALPSTSGLYTRLTLQEKIDRWKVIKYIPGIR
jgi:hypoxanthine-DNA glycosylase